MKVSQKALSRYRKEVNGQAELARAYVLKSLDEYFRQNPDAGTADGRKFAIELLKASMPNFCDAAGTLAADFFDEICEAEGIEVSSQLYDTTDWDKVEDKIRYFAGRLNDDDVDAFKRDVVNATHYFVKRSAYENMIRNCEANEVRYARVPSGFETCSFCFMLASRGFVYRSEERARGAHGYHDNCDCCVVPGKKGRTVIEGYDPETMYRNWSMCEKAIGGDAEAREAWKSLPHDERDAYIQRHKSEELAFRQFRTNRIMREVETRDWHWLYTGKRPEYKILDGATPSDDEKETAKRLEPFGFKSEFRPTNDEDRTSDVFFVSGDRNTPWEFKHPIGDGRWTINHQFEEAAGQCSRIVIDITDIEKPETGPRWNRETIEEEAAKQLQYPFRITKGKHKGDTCVFDEVILVSKEGPYCRKFKRQEKEKR